MLNMRILCRGMIALTKVVLEPRQLCVVEAGSVHKRMKQICIESEAFMMEVSCLCRVGDQGILEKWKPNFEEMAGTTKCAALSITNSSMGTKSAWRKICQILTSLTQDKETRENLYFETN
jgi:hypothetical protein